MTQPPDLTAALLPVVEAITTQQAAIYNLAAGELPNHNQKLWLQQAWRRIDSALWSLRQITGQPDGPDTRGVFPTPNPVQDRSL